ncbi:MAG: SpvB/TcaC N-terminal domain-containing protein, partial [Gammaproteobacteria bacterium]
MSVQPSTGVFHASLPIALPPARGGPQPSLGIHYSSAAGIRDAGIGWGLEMPAIERRGPSGGAPSYRDPKPRDPGLYPYWKIEPETRDTRFAFNGEPLVPICEVGSVVPCTAADGGVMPEWADTGWFYFRLENEGSFSRFFWSPDRQTWRVQLKGGDILEFGRARVLPSATASSIDEEEYAGTDPATGAAAILRGSFRWNLVRSFSPGPGGGVPRNVIAYQWTRLGDTG